MADIIELIYEDHQWLRSHFFLLDHATQVADLTAIWEPLATRLDTHAAAEENVFYPALLKHGDAGDPRDETDDAIGDHNSIRDAVAESRKHRVGINVWYEAVGTARTENGKHLDEEEREAMPDFIKSSTPQQRHELTMAWLRFYHQRAGGKNVDTADKDPDDYIAEHS
ncbi:MAG: hemerythrin domain-containing protein [Jatrophihabitans sp.]